MAAASRVLPPLSFHCFRRNKVCQHMESLLMLKYTNSLFNSVKKYSFDLKLSYMKPVRAFASLGPVETGSAPNNSQRSSKSSERGNPADGELGFERELQEFFDEVKMMITMGNKNDAADLLRANYEAVKERINAGARGMEEAALIDIIALGYMALGDLKFVGTLLRMLIEVVDSLKDDELLLDPVLVHMGSTNSVFLVTPFLGMAKALASTGKATKAIEFYHRSITILESSRGPQSEDLVIPLFGLGNLLLQEGKAKDSETPFLRILDIYTKLHGKYDGRVGMAMCSLAHAKCAMGKADEAIHLYRNALQLVKDSNYLALDDSTVEKIRIDLAELLHVVGRGEEGRKLLEECLIITEKSKGKEHPSSVTHMINLATSHLRSKNFVEAERLLRTSIQIMSKTVSSNDQSITFPMLHLAVALYHLQRDEEAEQLALEALDIREKAFGKDSIPVAEALDCLVSIQNRLIEDDGVLLEKLNRVLRIQEKELGFESEEVLETLKKIVFYLDKLGRKDEKLSIQKRLSMLRKKFKQRIPY
ncbi:hypothetical protein CsatA_009135 [Cannabis sativa]